MNVSQNAIELIAGFEGLRLDAYIDPVGIPTIGYGTIRYPNGTKVRMGDRITEDEAEEFLMHEATKFAREINEIFAGIELNQNQFDALVSFTYNLGPGNLRSSTLLKRLKQGDFDAAAKEFEKWNKATVDGVKKVLPGLTIRRQTERALFERPTGMGEPLPDEVSDQEKAVMLQGFRDGDQHVIVARDEAGAAVDIVELAGNDIDALRSVLSQYPNANKFEIAAAGDRIPEGERTEFVIRERLIKRPKQVPKLDQQLLQRGSKDSETGHNDVEELQKQLQLLGYYNGPIDGHFGSGTDDSVRRFQTDIFGHAEADGKVGPLTWEKLFASDEPKKPEPEGQPAEGLNYLRLTKTNQRDNHGLVVLKLDYFKDGVKHDSINVCSGSPRHQKFRTAQDSMPRTFEPLPEGRWTISNVKWADGKNNFNGRVWSKGLGPAKIFMCFKQPGTTRRSAIEIHIDWNKSGGKPGSAGCICPHDVAGFKTLLSWLRDTDPRSVYVDWGLETCPEPKAPEATSSEKPCEW